MKEASVSEIGRNYYNSRSEKDYTILYNRVMPGLVSHIRGFVTDHDTATDLALITMAKAYNKIHQYKPQFSISTWIYTIGSNVARTYLNKKKKQGHILFTQMEFQNDNGSASNDKLESAISIDNEFIVNEDRLEEEASIKAEFDYMVNIINNMKESYRHIVYDRFVGELSYNELSKKHNVALMTVKNRVTRGHKMVLSEFNRLQAAAESERLKSIADFERLKTVAICERSHNDVELVD